MGLVGCLRVDACLDCAEIPLAKPMSRCYASTTLKGEHCVSHPPSVRQGMHASKEAHWAVSKRR